MSDNFRKNVNTYKMPNFYVRATVYRPNSMRAVSAEKELNRLQAKVEELQSTIKRVEARINQYNDDNNDEAYVVAHDIYEILKGEPFEALAKGR